MTTARRAVSLALAALATALVSSPGLAVMPPWVYKEARDKAMFHVQVKVLSVTPPDSTPGECGVTAEVIKIFRDRAGGLKPGDRIEFGVSCTKRGDPAMPGGTLWTDMGRLRKARFMEVFLNRDAGRYEIALWQSLIVERPTREPAWPSDRN